MEFLPSIDDAALAGQLQLLVGASKFATALCRQHPETLEELVASGDLQRSYAENAVALALQKLLQNCDSDEELSKRDVTDNDVSHARYAQAVIEADRSVIRTLSGKVREKGLIRILIALLGINADFLV